MFGPTQEATRIGLLVPASNAVMEVEFYRSLPADITVHTSHIHRAQQNLSREALTEMADNARETALSLVALEPALIVYGHTASSYLGGPAGDAEYQEHLADIEKGSDVWGLAAVFAAQAVIRPADTRDYLIRMLDVYKLRMTRGVGQRLMRSWPTSY